MPSPLSLFAKGTSNLSLDKLKQTCSEYLSLQFPMGAIELPLKCAHDWDPEESAFGFWRDGEHEHDPRKGAFERRKECYNIVFSTLLAFDEMLDDEVAGRPRQNGQSCILFRLNLQVTFAHFVSPYATHQALARMQTPSAPTRTTRHFRPRTRCSTRRCTTGSSAGR